MITTKQILDALDSGEFEYQSSSGHWYEAEGNDFWYEAGWGLNAVKISGVEHPATSVEDIGGEGQGEYAAVIFTIGEQMFRKEGYYQSHDGTTWDGDFTEVEPYEKTVIDYRPINRKAAND